MISLERKSGIEKTSLAGGGGDGRLAAGVGNVKAFGSDFGLATSSSSSESLPL